MGIQRTRIRRASGHRPSPKIGQYYSTEYYGSASEIDKEGTVLMQRQATGLKTGRAFFPIAAMAISTSDSQKFPDPSQAAAEGYRAEKLMDVGNWGGSAYQSYIDSQHVDAVQEARKQGTYADKLVSAVVKVQGAEASLSSSSSSSSCY